jgi:metal-responsive CopG/Arc/MetJ family transcriptional regulator
MAVQTINISLPSDLLKQIDVAAKAEFASRSDFIRQALVGKLRNEAKRDLLDNWLVLEALSNEFADAAEARGLLTDEDFVKAVKDSRRKTSSK